MTRGDISQNQTQLAIQRFEEIFRRDPPDCLFHYTDQKGILGILASGELWATKIQYMNDSSEWIVAIRHTNEIIKERLSSTTDSNAQKLLRCIIDHIHGITNVNVCAVSFCADSDILSQWRGYAGDNSGFAIGFRSASLSKIANGHGGQLGRCIYNEEEQREAISILVDFEIYNLGKYTGFSEVELQDASSHFERMLIKYGILFKDVSFKEEDEWRLVTDITGYHDERFCFRPGKSMLIPYYKIPLRQQNIWRDEILSVTVGPCPHPDLAKVAIDGLVFKHGLTDGENSIVKKSRIPYRSW
jgi:Protein of unknown function (DUF2971)